MKYFLDTEFYEYKKRPLIGKAIDTIELISIGIVSENVQVHTDTMTNPVPDKPGKEYYAICNEFDLKAAWNSYQLETEMRDTGMTKVKIKNYWLRENVLKPIFNELIQKEAAAEYKANQLCITTGYNPPIKFTRKNLGRLLKKYGKSKAQIAKEVLYFCSNGYFNKTGFDLNEAKDYELYDKFKPEFYAYYADYDWVVLCWLFGRMIDLPKGFPMYCRDLKQMMDDKRILDDNGKLVGLQAMKQHPDYPKQKNEHNAMADAKWNKELFEFLNKI